jgi:hypothetical protein
MIRGQFITNKLISLVFPTGSDLEPRDVYNGEKIERMTCWKKKWPKRKKKTQTPDAMTRADKLEAQNKLDEKTIAKSSRSRRARPQETP